MENQVEIWKEVKGYEGIYEVSNMGNVKSLSRISFLQGKYPFVMKEKILKKSISLGYLTVCLTKDGFFKNPKIHRLVAIAFIPNPENKREVNHKDGDKTNNNDWNLEWNTSKENINHAIENKLNIRPRGEKQYNSRLTEKEVLEIRASNLKQKELAKIYNVNFQNISCIKLRKTWKHI